MIYEEFKKVIKKRRSIRVFTEEKVDDRIIENAIEDALLAPNSSNLQPWYFHWVKRCSKYHSKISEICFGQSGAKSSQHLILVTAKTNTWKRNSKIILEQSKNEKGEIPDVVKNYYTKMVPFAYGMIGPFGVLSPLKFLIINCIGIFKNIFREPVWPSDLKIWASKSTSLACENFMLSITAQGYASLPMEGYDSKRLKRLLGLKKSEIPVMIIAVGKADDKGLYGPQLRIPIDLSLKKYNE